MESMIAGPRGIAHIYVKSPALLTANLNVDTLLVDLSRNDYVFQHLGEC